MQEHVLLSKEDHQKASLNSKLKMLEMISQMSLRLLTILSKFKPSVKGVIFKQLPNDRKRKSTMLNQLEVWMLMKMLKARRIQKIKSISKQLKLMRVLLRPSSCVSYLINKKPSISLLFQCLQRVADTQDALIV